jgi:hypothetical protein
MILTVVIPTVPGREVKLARTLFRYRQTVPAEVVMHEMIIRGYPTCGEAWNMGGEMAAFWDADPQRNLLHFGADDLMPMPGWWEAATTAVWDDREIPAPLVLKPSGEVESRGSYGGSHKHGALVSDTVVPIMPLGAWAAVRPIPSIHYWSDNYVGRKLIQAGWTIRMNDGFAFTHNQSPSDPGRGVTRVGEEQIMRDAL